MGVMVHLSERKWMRRFLSNVVHPELPGRQVNQSAFLSFLFSAVAMVVAAVVEGEGGHYKSALIFFVVAWLFGSISTWLALTIYSRLPRIVWTSIVALFWGGIMLAVYLWACPTFKIFPSSPTYQTWAGQSYEFRIDNMSDRDQYMASFIFEITSSVYSINDFTFTIPSESVRALDQEPTQTDRNADIFGLFGPWSDSHHFFLLYVYHFAPHESRKVTITLDQHVMSTEREFQILTRTMSYSHSPLPISKNDDYVLIPIRLDRALTVTNFLPCFVNGNPPCYSHPQLGKRAEFPEGCNYWMISDSPHPQPIHVRFPERCD